MSLLRPFGVSLAAACVLAAGCTESGLPPGAKPTEPVTVTVTYKGAPVEGATVTFLHEEYVAYGKTDAAGAAKMKSYNGAAEGAVAGTYPVTISKMDTPPDTSADISSPDYVPPSPDAPGPVIKHLIPEKYSLKSSSGLTAEVKSGQNNIPFELTD